MANLTAKSFASYEINKSKKTNIQYSNFVITKLSICTHFPCFENMGQFVALKKIRPKIWIAKKQGIKNRIIVIKKEKRPGCFFSLLIRMTLFFAPYISDPIPDPKEISG